MSKLFKNLKAGVVEEVFNKDIIAQYEKRPDIYAPVEDKVEDTGLSYKEMKALAKEMGLDFAGNISKDDLQKLIDENQE